MKRNQLATVPAHERTMNRWWWHGLICKVDPGTLRNPDRYKGIPLPPLDVGSPRRPPGADDARLLDCAEAKRARRRSARLAQLAAGGWWGQ